MYQQDVVIETTTVDEDTLDNVIQVMESGGILIIEDFDHKLLELVKPVIEMRWKSIFNSIILGGDGQDSQSDADCYDLNGVHKRDVVKCQ